MESCNIESIFLTLKVISIVSILHLIFGTLLGLYLSFSKGILKDIVESIVTLPLIFPPIAIGFFLILIFGRDGFIGEILIEHFNFEIIFSFTALIIASFIAGLPLIVKPTQSAIETTPKDIVEASYTLGKSKFETLIKVTIPMIKINILAGLTLSIGRSLGEVGITLMLGGNIIGRTDTISLAIYNAVLDGEFDCAIKLSLILGLISMTLFFILRKLKAI